MTYLIAIINYTLAAKNIAPSDRKILIKYLTGAIILSSSGDLNQLDGIKIQINTNLYNNAMRSQVTII